MSESTAQMPESDSLDVTIEHAKPEDAEAIMIIKQKAWLAAYPNEEHGITEKDIQDKLTDEELRRGITNWKEGIESETDGGNRRTFVARAGDRVVGYTSPCIEDGQRRIGQLYVLPEMQGRGVGGELLKQALKWHGAGEKVFLRTVSYNQNAIGFYENFGFIKTGVEFPESFDEEHKIKLLPEVEMVCEVKPTIV